MKILAAIFVILIFILQYRIWLGENSFAEIGRLNARISEQVEQNKLLAQQNAALKKEILLLRTNAQILEEKAREQLGLVKPGETFYRIIPAEEPDKKNSKKMLKSQ